MPVLDAVTGLPPHMVRHVFVCVCVCVFMTINATIENNMHG